jgi:hypothetical protein
MQLQNMLIIIEMLTFFTILWKTETHLNPSIFDNLLCYEKKMQTLKNFVSFEQNPFSF